MHDGTGVLGGPRVTASGAPRADSRSAPANLEVLWLTVGYPSTANPDKGTYSRNQAEALARAGVKLTVIAPVPWIPPLPAVIPRKYQQFLSDPSRESLGGVEVHRPRYVTIPRELYYGAPHWFIRRTIAGLALQRPHLVHAHSAYPHGLVGQWLSRIWAVPCVLTLHGNDVHTIAAANAWSRRRVVRAVTGADEVVAVSAPLAAQAQELTGRAPLVMPIGVNLKQFDDLPARAHARRVLDLPEDHFVVLYVGNLLESKGLHELLRALQQLAGTRVTGVFVGVGPLLERVKRAPDTVALGAQPNDRMPLFMAAADVLVLPSYNEGLPTVVVEAGAAGVPVIATTVGGTPELLAGERGVLIPPRSAEAIVSAIVSVRQDAAAARTRAAALRKLVRQQYDVDANALKLIALYEGLLQ